MNRSIFVFLLLSCLPLAALPQADSKETLNIHTSPVKYDSIIASWKANNLVESTEQFLEDEYIILDTSRYLQAVSTVSDTICRARLRTIPSPIHLPYNDIVRKHIVAYTTTHKSITRRMLTYGKYYFPMIEQELDKNGLPLELKIVPVIESALNPTAVSRRGAVGLWQFMLQTGRQYGLEVTSMVDNRCDPILATEAACKYLKQAYARFGNWESVAASYNAGQGRISKQMDSQYADNALDLQLVEETARYVYRILAAKMMLTNPKQFGFRLKSSDLYPIIPYRNITVEESIDDLARFAKGQGINYALLRNMNPWLRSRSLHVHGSKVYYLRIPDKEGMRYNPRVLFPHDPKWVVP